MYDGREAGASVALRFYERWTSGHVELVRTGRERHKMAADA
jgi:hypothetical protein